jgi:hypothetical protein
MERVVAKMYQLPRVDGAFQTDGKKFLRNVKTTRNVVEEHNEIYSRTGILYEIDDDATIENNMLLEQQIKERKDAEKLNGLVGINALADALKVAVSEGNKVQTPKK